MNVGMKFSQMRHNIANLDYRDTLIKDKKNKHQKKNKQRLVNTKLSVSKYKIDDN